MRPYAAGFMRGLRRSIADPGAILMLTVFLAIVLTVYSSLWGAAVEAHGGSIAGFTLRSLLWYTLCAQAAVAGVRSRIIEEIGDDIGSGGVSIAMLRPVSVVGMRLAIDAGEGLARIVAVFVVDGALTCLLVGAPPSWGDLALAVPAAMLGCAANLAAQTAFGGMAFWLGDAKAAWFLYQKLVFLPGGMLIPLDLLPAGIASVVRPLPFASMAYAPGSFGSGHADLSLLTVQVFWVVVLTGLAVAVFARGQRRLEVLGG